MKITIINLDRARDRLVEITSHLRALGLEFTVHKAVDAMNFPPECDSLVDWMGMRRDGRSVYMGSVANYISQRQVLQEMVDNGPDVMVVLEDDAIPRPQLPDVLAELEVLIDGLDIVFLHFGPDKPFVSAQHLSTGHHLGWIRWSHFGTQGYIITRRAAKIFLETYPLVRTGIDRALASYWRHGLRTMCVRPPVILHAERFQHTNSLKLHAPVVVRQGAMSRIRRSWFMTKEGVAKRISFAQIMIDTYGLTNGFRNLVDRRSDLHDYRK